MSPEEARTVKEEEYEKVSDEEKEAKLAVDLAEQVKALLSSLVGGSSRRRKREITSCNDLMQRAKDMSYAFTNSNIDGGLAIAREILKATIPTCTVDEEGELRNLLEDGLKKAVAVLETIRDQLEVEKIALEIEIERLKSDDASSKSDADTICEGSSVEPITDSKVQEVRDSTICTLNTAKVMEIKAGEMGNPQNVKNVEDILSETKFEALFPNKNKAYTYTNFLRAVGKFPAICKSEDTTVKTVQICKKTLATMFAHFMHETGGLSKLEEDNIPPLPEYNDGTNTNYPVVEGQQYYGRGAIQLSWNYNYGPFSHVMYRDASFLLDRPHLLAHTWLNFASAIWFFAAPQPPKPSLLQVVVGDWNPKDGQAGFGATTMIINGGKECGAKDVAPEHKGAAQSRANFYTDLASTKENSFDFDIKDEELLCDDTETFEDKGSASETNLFWDCPESAATKTGCRLVSWRTRFSALVEGDYQRCSSSPCTPSTGDSFTCDTEFGKKNKKIVFC